MSHTGNLMQNENSKNSNDETTNMKMKVKHLEFSFVYSFINQGIK